VALVYKLQAAGYRLQVFVFFGLQLATWSL